LKKYFKKNQIIYLKDIDKSIKIWYNISTRKPQERQTIILKIEFISLITA